LKILRRLCGESGKKGGVMDKFILWFEEVDKASLPLVGGKGANLGEMTKAGIPVPPGFIVSVSAYEFFLMKTKFDEEIRKLLENLDVNDSKTLVSTAYEIQRRILSLPMPPEISREIRDAYGKLGGPVAVRSSATAEDVPEASFAGQQKSFLNVEGEENVIKAVQECWASLFEPRAIFYRTQMGFDHFKVKIAVPVQKMVQSEVSGVMFTVDPVTGDDRIVIEAVWGLGEAIVSGSVNPDMYIVEKGNLRIISKKLEKQDVMLKRGDGRNVWAEVPEDKINAQKLRDEDIKKLAELGERIEKHYNFPQDIEWAYEKGELYIVQSRPITTLKPREEAAEIEGKVIVEGSPASPGIGSGPVRIVRDVSEISKAKEGDVLVAEMTTPDFVPAMKKAAAIVTDKGGRTCHAAIVSRELGIPSVVGTGDATKKLKEGEIVTVDGYRGKVYEGKIEVKEEEKKARPGTWLKTKTKIYVNLADPSLAEETAKRNVDGVGLLRAEFIIANHIGEHPNLMLKEGRGMEFARKLAEGLKVFAKAFDPRPVVYRTTDFKTNEYRQLKGGEEFEEEEENPMLGYRGCSRYMRDTEAFKLELEAIKMVRKEYKNLWVMIPFVRTPEEMRSVLEIMRGEGLSSSEDFKIWMMAEIPSNFLLLEEFIDTGIDGISIGSNDLTQLILGVDRDNSKIADLFDEMNPAVLMAIERIIKVSREKGITCSICGQAPSFYPQLTEKLVEWGITSISINRDVIEQTREIVAEVERRLGM